MTLPCASTMTIAYGAFSILHLHRVEESSIVTLRVTRQHFKGESNDDSVDESGTRKACHTFADTPTIRQRHRHAITTVFANGED